MESLTFKQQEIMSFWILCNFLQKQTQRNAETQKAMQELSIEIERYEILQQEQLDTLEMKVHLQIELQFLHSIEQQLQEECQQRDTMALALCAAHQNSIQLYEQIKRVDLQKIAGYEIFLNDMKLQQDHRELEETYRKRQELCQRMDDRTIVKQLRSKQVELKTVSAELEEVKKCNQNSFEKTIKKLGNGQKQRNNMVLSLVQGAKRLESLREEIKNVCGLKEKFLQLQAKKIELTEQWRNLQMFSLTQKPIFNSTNRSMAEPIILKKPQELTTKTDITPRYLINPPTFDLYDPLAFIKSLDIKSNIERAMKKFHPHLQVEKQKEEKVVSSQTESSLRSILRRSSLDKENQLVTTTRIAPQESRHVHFDVPSTSSSNSLSSPEPRVDDVVNKEDMQNHVFNTIDIQNSEPQLNRADKKTKIEEESLITFTLSSEISPAQPSVIHLYEADAETKKKPAVEILECKVVKPAGTEIPKTLPVSITPSPTPDEDIPYSQCVEVRTTTPIDPNPVPKLFKSPINVFDKKVVTKKSINNALKAFLHQQGRREERSSTTDSEESTKPQQGRLEERSSTTDSEESSQAKPNNTHTKPNKSLDFNSLYLSNVSPESVAEEQNLATTSNVNTGGSLLDFDLSTDQMDNDDALNFSDNDFQMNGRKIQDFF